MNKPRARGADVTFTPSAGRTLGVEWELGLLDPVTLDLVSRADELLGLANATDGSSHARPTRSRSTVTQELLRNTVEIVTGVCANAEQAASDLADGLGRVQSAATELDVLLYGGGSHPFARWEDQEVSDGHRYATLIDRTQWWGRQMVIFGVHVHVGIRSAAKVWPLINALLTYHPHLTALSASSPYWSGTDTGYASNRTMLFQQLPTAGLPFQFETWAQYRAYLDDVFTTGVVTDASELRWDIRPSPLLGTIEVRACDGFSRGRTSSPWPPSSTASWSTSRTSSTRECSRRRSRPGTCRRTSGAQPDTAWTPSSSAMPTTPRRTSSTTSTSCWGGSSRRRARWAAPASSPASPASWMPEPATSGCVRPPRRTAPETSVPRCARWSSPRPADRTRAASARPATPGEAIVRWGRAQVSSSSRRSSAVSAEDIAAPSSTTRANRSRLRSCRATTFSSMVSRETIR